MLTLAQVCEWFGVTERHVRKLVERSAIPYRKVGHLLRFPEAEIEEWSHPKTKSNDLEVKSQEISLPKQRSSRYKLPKNLIE